MPGPLLPPAIPPAPARRHSSLLIAGVVVGAAVVVLVVAATLLVRPGGLLPVAAPCEASPGSTLAGFPDDVVGPTDVTAVLVTSWSSSVPVGLRACFYGSPGVGWGRDIPPGGRGVHVLSFLRAEAERDPEIQESLRSGEPARTPSGARPVVLPGSGVTAFVQSSSSEDATATEAWCRTSTAYYDLTAARSGTGTDDVDALDGLTAALGCEPIGPI